MWSSHCELIKSIGLKHLIIEQNLLKPDKHGHWVLFKRVFMKFEIDFNRIAKVNAIHLLLF